MQEITVTYDEISGRFVVPIYDVVDSIKRTVYSLRTEDMPSVIATENPDPTHVAYMEGTLDGLDIIAEWLEFSVRV